MSKEKWIDSRNKSRKTDEDYEKMKTIWSREIPCFWAMFESQQYSLRDVKKGTKNRNEIQFLTESARVSLRIFRFLFLDFVLSLHEILLFPLVSIVVGVPENVFFSVRTSCEQNNNWSARSAPRLRATRTWFGTIAEVRVCWHTNTTRPRSTVGAVRHCLPATRAALGVRVFTFFVFYLFDVLFSSQYSCNRWVRARVPPNRRRSTKQNRDCRWQRKHLIKCKWNQRLPSTVVDSL